MKGEEPEKTNYFLQAFYKAATSGKDFSKFIGKYLEHKKRKKEEAQKEQASKEGNNHNHNNHQGQDKNAKRSSIVQKDSAQVVINSGTEEMQAPAKFEKQITIVSNANTTTANTQSENKQIKTQSNTIKILILIKLQVLYLINHKMKSQNWFDLNQL